MFCVYFCVDAQVCKPTDPDVCVEQSLALFALIPGLYFFLLFLKRNLCIINLCLLFCMCVDENVMLL